MHDDANPDKAISTRKKIVELTEFLTDIIGVKNLDAHFPHKVGLHQSCHGLRGLKLAQMSELIAPPFSKPENLLSMVKGLELIDLERKDECCGFGGTFCVFEEAVSVKMGQDRVADHTIHGAEYITGVDMSCLMHLDGILRRQKSNVKVIHIAEILNSVTNCVLLKFNQVVMKVTEYIIFNLRGSFTQLFPLDNLMSCFITFLPDEPKCFIMPVHPLHIAVEFIG